MVRKNCAIFLIFTLPIIGLSQEQETPFEHEILTFEQWDTEHGNQTNFILFVGSSSIKLWSTLEMDFSECNVLNRGFGGAKLIDLNFYWKRILADHEPKLVVLYCGENDIYDGHSIASTFRQFKKFQRKIKKDLKRIPLIYIAMKPSPNRWEKWTEFQKTDKKIKRAIWWRAKQKFIDLSPSMLRSDGFPKPEIFVSDQLHMNQEGYKGWVAGLKPLIKDIMPDNSCFSP